MKLFESASAARKNLGFQIVGELASAGVVAPVLVDAISETVSRVRVQGDRVASYEVIGLGEMNRRRVSHLARHLASKFVDGADD